MSEALRLPDLPSAVAAEHFCLRIPSRPEWIGPTVDYLKQRAILCGACHESRADSLGLALHEALTNSVVHGNLELSSDLKEQGDTVFAEALAARAADPAFGERIVDVETRYDGESCCWVLTDQGQGFDVERVLRRAEEPDEEAFLRASGRGLLMTKAFLDEVRYEAGGRRALLTLYRSSGKERRRNPRLAVQTPVRVVPVRPDGSVDWDAAYAAVARNLSPEGMGILQARLATAPRVLIALDWQGQVLYLPAEVRHCQSLGGDAVEIGCDFRPSSSPTGAGPSEEEAGAQQAVGKLLDQLAGQDTAHDERRSHQRAAYTARIGISGGLRPGPVARRHLVLDGGSFGLGAARADLAWWGYGPLRLRAEVLRCTPLLEGVFAVAARFLDLEK
jgi:anti-sigma regulatory factor (Ser/Thr protein kinase)